MRICFNLFIFNDLEKWIKENVEWNFPIMWNILCDRWILMCASAKVHKNSVITGQFYHFNGKWNLLLGTNPSGNHMIFNTMGQCKVVVPWCGYISILDQSIVKMTVETIFNFTHIFDLSNTANTDLFSLFDIWLWLWHFRKISFYLFLLIKRLNWKLFQSEKIQLREKSLSKMNLPKSNTPF